MAANALVNGKKRWHGLAMIWKMLALLTVLATGTAAQAQDPGRKLSAAEFEAFTTGKTLSYATEGNTPYGAEEYLPGRRVRWAFTGQECTEGEWYEAGELICFLYEDNPEAQCWSFFLTPQGLRAQFENREDTPPLYQIGESPEPLFCPGPEVGV